MLSFPTKWATDQLKFDSVHSASLFRAERLEASDAWESHFRDANRKFELLFEKLHDLTPEGVTEERLAASLKLNLGEALRYLAGPPISDDDLKVLADVESLAPSVISADAKALMKVFDVIERVLDAHRFPWVSEDRRPTAEERNAALLSSSVLLAATRIATERRKTGKNTQEGDLKTYLKSLGFSEVSPTTIKTVVHGPQTMQFCAEAMLGTKKADVVLRLHDTRLFAFECKVSNSSTNSVKRLNNDVAAKAEAWTQQFGTQQIVPAAMLAGVFKVLNLEQAQDRNVAIFWSHDLGKVGEFIESTRLK